MNNHKKVKITPAIIGANPVDLKSAVLDAESGGADAIHLDIMDGHFAPHITFGLSTVSAIKNITNLPLDVHLMISNPEECITDFIHAGTDTLTVHVEACTKLHNTIMKIKDLDCKAGVAIKPATSLTSIEEIINDIDLVLIMTVDPGFSHFINKSVEKIQRLRKILDSQGKSEILIAVDGGINMNTAPLVVEAGASQLVSASAIYKEPEGVLFAINKLRASTQNAVFK